MLDPRVYTVTVMSAAPTESTVAWMVRTPIAVNVTVGMEPVKPVTGSMVHTITAPTGGAGANANVH